MLSLLHITCATGYRTVICTDRIPHVNMHRQDTAR